LILIGGVCRSDQAAAEEKLRQKFEADMAAERKRIEAMASSSKEEVQIKAKQQMEVGFVVCVCSMRCFGGLMRALFVCLFCCFVCVSCESRVSAWPN